MTVASGLTAGAYSVEVYADDGEIGFAPEAGFAISGSLADGGALTITGSGFGTMGGDVIQYARGDEGADGVPIHGSTPTAGSTLTTFVIGLGSDTTGQHLLYSNANPRTGRARSLRRRGQANGTGTARNGGFGYPDNNKTQLYISYNRYAAATSWVQATLNLKQYYVFSNGTNGGGFGETPQPILFVPAGDSRWAMGPNNGYGADTHQFNSAGWSISDSFNAWQRWESYLVLGTPAANATDGQFSVWRDGVRGLHDTTFKWQGDMTTPATAFSYLRLGHMDTSAVGFTADYSDYYVADTQARVEIGNASTWAACTQKEIQLARNAGWSDTSIAATLNTGALSALAGNYLYVVKSDGSAVKIGQFT
jgi:hypothetical protein